MLLAEGIFVFVCSVGTVIISAIRALQALVAFAEDISFRHTWKLLDEGARLNNQFMREYFRAEKVGEELPSLPPEESQKLYDLRRQFRESVKTSMKDFKRVFWFWLFILLGSTSNAILSVVDVVTDMPH